MNNEMHIRHFKKYINGHSLHERSSGIEFGHKLMVGIQGSYPFLDKKFKVFSRTHFPFFKDFGSFTT